MPFAFTFTAASGMTLYFEAAAGVTTAVLAGRYLEARARDRSASALTALAALGAKSAAVLRDGAEHRVPGRRTGRGRAVRGPPGREDRRRRRRRRGQLGGGRLARHRRVRARRGRAGRPGDRGHGEHERPAGRPRHPGRRRHAAGPDHPAGHPGAGHQGERAAARGPDRRRLRALRDRPGRARPSASGWAPACPPPPPGAPPSPSSWSPARARSAWPRPTALVAAVGRGAELGILVKSARALEPARRIRIVVLDKTGTLTAGAMTVAAVITCPRAPRRRRRCCSPARSKTRSEHPIGQAIAREAAARFGGLPPVTGFTALPGAGVRGRVGDRDVTVGSPALFAELPLEVPAVLRAAVAAAEDDGRTAVLAGWDGQARAALVVADQLRPGAAAAVARLRRLGLRPVLLTGDNEQAARAVARQVGIPADSVFAGVRPEGKAEVIRRAAGRRAAGRVRRRRRQRRGRPRPGRPRHGDRHRHRRRHRRRRPHAGQRRPGRRSPTPSSSPAPR